MQAGDLSAATAGNVWLNREVAVAILHSLHDGASSLNTCKTWLIHAASFTFLLPAMERL
jgi:hypothetical protein